MCLILCIGQSLLLGFRCSPPLARVSCFGCLKQISHSFLLQMVSTLTSQLLCFLKCGSEHNPTYVLLYQLHFSCVGVRCSEDTIAPTASVYLTPHFPNITPCPFLLPPFPFLSQGSQWMNPMLLLTIYWLHCATSSPVPVERPQRMNNILTSATEPYDLSLSRSFQNLSHLPPPYELALKSDLSNYSYYHRLSRCSFIHSPSRCT